MMASEGAHTRYFLRMLDIKFVSVEEIGQLMDELPLLELEKLLAQKIRDLPAESKARVVGLSETGLTVVTGSFVSLNSDVAINIQNSGAETIDPEALFKALAEFKKSSGEKK